jgi:MSHA pilin protein MshC
MPVRFSINQQGFTLTELVAIMIIMSVLAAVAMPRFLGVQIFESRGFYDEVLSSLRFAQKMAVGTGCEIQFTITTLPAPGSYGIFRKAACDSADFAGAVPIINPRTGIAYPTDAPDGAAFSAITNFPIVFNAFGQAINAGGIPSASPTATVTVGGRVITILAETGLVTGP